MKNIAFLVMLSLIISCSNEKVVKEENGIVQPVNDEAIKQDSILRVFSIRLATQLLSLQQWDSTINLQKELGVPVSDNTRVLDENSDTFSGSSVKKIKYDGLQLGLFSPQQNGKTFWVQEIIITKPKYYTADGITVGDSLAKIKKAYPTLQLFPGNTDNMYYVSAQNYEYSIEFEIENEKAKKIRLYYMMN